MKSMLKFVALVLPMLLIGCTDPSSTQSSSPTGGGTPTGNTDSTVSTSTSTPDVDVDDPYVIDPEDSQWPENVTESMVKYLGGQVLPYVNMGNDIDVVYNDKVSTDNYKSSLVLTGGMFVPAYLDAAKGEYANHDWVTNIWKNTSLYATREKQNLEVEVTSTSKGLFQLTAYWNEPYDPTSVTAWDASTVLSMKEHFGQFYNIPFVYLGTRDYAIAYSDDPSSAMTVTGGLWDDQIYDEFEESFSNGGWSIKDDETDSTKKIATKNESNGTILTATLSKYNNRARLVVGMDEAFDKSNQDSWSTEIKEAYSKVTSETLPYVYLGSTYPSVVTSGTNSRKLTIKGNKWDDGILDDAKATFGALGYTETTNTDSTEEGEEETIGINLTKSTTSTKFDVSITKTASGTEGEYYPLMVVSVSEIFDATTVSDWSDSVKSEFTKKFSDTMSSIMPFMYLGSTNAFVDTDYNRDYEMVICGGAYDEKVISVFDQTFSDWVIVTEHGKVQTGTTYKNNNVVYRVALKNFDDVTYKVGLFSLYTGVDKTTYLEITKSVRDSYTASITDWTADTKTLLTEYFGSSVSIPYFDMGVTSNEMALLNGKIRLCPSFIYASSNSNYMDIYTKLKDDGWDVKFEFNGNFAFSSYLPECILSQLTATKTFGDDSIRINFTFGRPDKKGSISSSSGNYIEYDEVYDEDDAPSDGWGEELNTFITDTYKLTLPYFYMGTKHTKYFYDKDSNTLTVTGNKWSKEIASDDKTTNKSPIITNARKVLTEEAGFNIASSSTAEANIATSVNAKLVVTYKTSDEEQVTINISKGSSYGIIAPIMIITTTEPNYYDGSITEWNDAVKTALNENLSSNMTLPYLYLGNDSPTVVVDNTTFAELPYLTITGATWNVQVIATVEEMLNADGGWTVTTSGSGTSTILSAYKLYSDYSALRLYVKRVGATKTGYFNTLYVLIDKPETTATLKSWSTTSFYKSTTGTDSEIASTLMGQKFDGKALPDFLYTKDSESYKITYSLNSNSANRSLVLKSAGTNNYGYFTPSYVYRAKEILENDGFEVTLNPFGSLAYFMPSLYATKKNSDGSTFYMTYGAANNSTYNQVTNTSTTSTAVKARTNLVGFNVTTYYLPDFMANTETAWGNDTSGTSIITTLKNNVIEIPFFNMGTPSSEIYVQSNATNHYVSLKSYNYDDTTSITDIKKTLEASGWEMHYAYYYPKKITNQEGSTDVNEALPYSGGSTAEMYLSGTYADDDGNVYVLSVTQSMTTAKTGTLLSANTEVRISRPKID